MQRIKRVMVVIEQQSKTHPALQRALQLAADQDMDLLLYSVLQYPMIEAAHVLNDVQLSEVRDAMVKYQENRLAELMNDVQRDNIQCHMRVDWQSPGYINIIQAAEQFQADLVLVSCAEAIEHGEREDVLQLTKACPVPLLLVNRAELPADASVIAAIDPGHKLSVSSKLDTRVLSAAYRLANQLDKPLHACHCFDPSYWEVLLEAVKSAQIWTDVFPAQQETEATHVVDLLKEHHHKAFVQQCNEWVPASANQHMLQGEVSQALPKLVASLKGATLVLGTTYRTGLLGSTAEKLLGTLDCDILAIKPLGFETPVQ